MENVLQPLAMFCSRFGRRSQHIAPYVEVVEWEIKNEATRKKCALNEVSFMNGFYASLLPFNT